MIRTDELSTGFAKIFLRDLACITSHTRPLEIAGESIDIVANGVAHVGSVVVCRIESIGIHKELENRWGNFDRIQSGDLILGVMGNRHSPVSVYGGLPDSGIALPRLESIDLLSSGGVIGECSSCPHYLGSPTKLHIVGLAAQNGKLLEVIPWLKNENLSISCPLILISGTSAEVGKTRFASNLIRFLSQNLGQTVAATKLTGTGDLEDLLKLHEAGAELLFDLVDAGLVTTYKVSKDVVVEITKGVLNHLGKKNPGVIIAELGGDILATNAEAIIADKEISAAASAMILIPSEVLAAYGALNYLEEKGFPRSKVYIAQPKQNPEASRERASHILHYKLYDCTNDKDLADLLEKVLGWSIETESQHPQKVDSTNLTT